MSTITEADLSVQYWCTSEDVRDEFQLEINNREPDFERRIEKATRRLQAWYEDAAGTDPPADPPDLLRDATALLAASLAHQAFSQNIAGQNQEDQRHVFLEDAARDTFDDWKVTADLDPESEPSGAASDTVQGLSGTINGDNPIYRGDE